MKRSFPFLMATVIGAWFLSLSVSCVAHSAAGPTDVGLSVQLWSVKEDLKADFKGTIAELADMGFTGIELAGEYGEFADDPEGLANFVQSVGLQISGAHTVFAQLEEQTLHATLDFFKRAGVPLVVVAWDDRAFSKTTVWQTVGDLNRLQSVVESYGMRLGYHNHAEEFGEYRATDADPLVTLWDYIARSTSNALVLQLDVGWAVTAGVSPVQYVRKYPGRSRSMHFKTAAPAQGMQSIIGQDDFDWAELIRVSREVGDVQWLVLEQEVYPADVAPLEAVRLSKVGLDAALQIASARAAAQP